MHKSLKKTGVDIIILFFTTFFCLDNQYKEQNADCLVTW